MNQVRWPHTQMHRRLFYKVYDELLILLLFNYLWTWGVTEFPLKLPWRKCKFCLFICWWVLKRKNICSWSQKSGPIQLLHRRICSDCIRHWQLWDQNSYLNRISMRWIRKQSSTCFWINASDVLRLICEICLPVLLNVQSADNLSEMFSDVTSTWFHRGSETKYFFIGNTI